MSDGRFQKGQIPWNKIAQVEKTCIACGKPFSVKPSLARIKSCSKACSYVARKFRPGPRTGAIVSAETRAKQRAAKLGIRGDAHWNWRGAARSERKRAMSRDEYKQWRWAVFERDDFTCQFCGVRGGKLHADHIEPWASSPDLRYEISNGRTLCVPCHHTTPSFPAKLIPKEMRS